MKDGSQEKGKEFATITNDHSKGPSSGFDIFDLEGEISNSETLPIKYLLNLEKNARDQKGSHILEMDETSNGSNQPYDLIENQDVNEDYADGNTESVVFIQGSEQSTSNEEESEDSLLSDDKSENYEPVLMKSGVKNEELYANDKGEYTDIPGKPYNKKHLKYILNMTQSEVEDEQKHKNETETKLNKEPNGQIIARPFGVRLSENNSYDDKDNKELTDKVLKNYFSLEENDTVLESFQLGDSVLRIGSEKNVSEENDTIQSAAEDVLQINGTNDNYGNQNSTAGKVVRVKVISQEPTIQENYTSLQDINGRQPKHTSHAFNNNQDQAEKIVVEKLFVDPCMNLHCKRGKICEMDLQGNPSCVCQEPKFCPPGNVNDHVCGTDNKTYDSPCHLFGTKCKLEGTKEGSHLHLDYQGHCKSIPPCSEYELALFPYRMRDWLKNVLVQLYERDLENSGFLSDKQRDKVKKIYENEKRLLEGDHNIDLLLRDFKKNYYMYVYPVHWQFNQLDRNLMDRLLTRSELAPLRVPLVPMEHCVTAFFQKCNTNKDKHISLTEWCQCFGIREDDINEDLLF
ncbi:SPARC-like protein 1 [Spea bombifrons]|uniref:SPARC-like protein 1 n=1 Tax=Spea bombifrons TaxID=233779 RepID=UPI00234A79EA|nr:SPARC-like protein 1 [Spea bombifrons]